jgi:N-methylhydantoinase B
LGLTLAADLIVRDGSVVSPEMPAPVNTYMPIANVVAEAVFEALAAPLPRARIAECGRGVSGTLSHISPDRRYPLVQYELPAGAVGARADKDGVSASKAHVANGAITPVEILETEFPVEITRFELVPDSGGAGRFRGGLSYVREYRMAGAGQFSTRGGHLRTPPRVKDGGRPGTSGATVVNPGTPDKRPVRAGEGNVRLRAGDVLRREMTGAGGYGDPLTRDVARARDDVREGYVSPSAARDLYGVIVVRSGHTWDVDVPATSELRAHRAER